MSNNNDYDDYVYIKLTPKHIYIFKYNAPEVSSKNYNLKFYILG